MNLSKLLDGIIETDISISIDGLCLNANNIISGDVFIALQGETTHGANYAQQAIDNGCVVILVDGMDIECSVPSIRIDNLKSHLQTIAARMYAEAQKVEVIGVTGTNGKTSVAYFASQLLDKLGVKNGLVGTLGISNSDIKSNNTTPDIITLYKALDQYYKNNINTAVIEISSHALDQNRIQGLNIKYAVFTNLTQDHLDYHHTLENYKKTKLKLFELESVKSVVINQDDENSIDFINVANDKKQYIYSLEDFDNLSANQYGFLAKLDNFVFELPQLGKYNALNILAALNTVEAMGFDIEKIIPLLPRLIAPIGRMQKINKSKVWVDYAHTPDAIKNAIETIKLHNPDDKVIIIFGCGGDRDQDKRHKMGKVASTFADMVVLTNDNPRSEDPESIINDITSGIDDSINIDITLDRELAIENAIHTLKEDESLLIAGKGHETYQIFKDKTIEFSDIEIAQNA